MTLQLTTVPCLTDNYAFILHDAQTGRAIVVDAPEAAPINATLSHLGATLDTLLITHHHYDHVEGVDDLAGIADAQVIGAAADAHRLPKLTREVTEGDRFDVCGISFEVWDVSGHTEGHVAYITNGYAFTGDSLMGLGCGRVMEGTLPQMWQSLQKFNALPDETLICSGHEYSENNAKFALTIEPENQALQERVTAIQQARKRNEPTIPSSLGLERQTNPFLRAGQADVKQHLGMPTISDAESFAEIRRRKDAF